MLRRSSPTPSLTRGFSLIEMMIAITIGLIVIGSVLGLVLSIMRANNQTIQATRLTQEMRATASMIAEDLKRSGSVIDPMTIATANAGKPLNPFAAIDAGTAGCIRYSYADNTGNNYHAVSRSDGAVFLDTVATNTASCGGGTRLSSRFITINALTFVVVGRRIDMTLQGSLISDPEITRTYSQTVFIRSVAGS